MFIHLRDRLCGEAYDLGSSIADAEKHVFVRDRYSRKIQILQYFNTDSVILLYNKSRSLEST